MYRVMPMTPLTPTLVVVGSVSGLPAATTGYPVSQNTVTGGKASRRGEPFAERTPPVRSGPARKRPAAGRDRSVGFPGRGGPYA